MDTLFSSLPYLSITFGIILFFRFFTSTKPEKTLISRDKQMFYNLFFFIIGILLLASFSLSMFDYKVKAVNNNYSFNLWDSFLFNIWGFSLFIIALLITLIMSDNTILLNKKLNYLGSSNKFKKLPTVTIIIICFVYTFIFSISTISHLVHILFNNLSNLNDYEGKDLITILILEENYLYLLLIYMLYLLPNGALILLFQSMYKKIFPEEYLVQIFLNDGTFIKNAYLYHKSYSNTLYIGNHPIPGLSKEKLSISFDKVQYIYFQKINKNRYLDQLKELNKEYTKIYCQRARKLK
ncbi:hypothetical protein [Salibacterium aidingense]|uniref:hypothetical protein n=1 Tax=Salibacterium aidingense TaxID=384933 RepID=UPI003BD2DB29